MRHLKQKPLAPRTGPANPKMVRNREEFFRQCTYRGISPSSNFGVGETQILLRQDRTQSIAPETDPLRRCSVSPEVLEIVCRAIVDSRVVIGIIVVSVAPRIWRL